MMISLFVQPTMVRDQHAAAGKILDLVIAKLNDDDRTSFDQLVYALVRTGQLDCARALDEELAQHYLQKDSKHG